MILELIENVIITIINFILEIISSIGYIGIFFLMILENVFFPIPSEIILAFSGFLVYKGRFDFFYVVIIGSLGHLIGSLIIYFLSFYLGRKLILNYGKYFFLKEKHLTLAEIWFKKYGSYAILLSKMVPTVRTLISIPAGISKMDLKKFSLFTFVGSIPWNFTLTYLGFLLGKNWEKVSEYTDMLNIIILLLIIFGIIYLVLKFKIKKFRLIK